MESGREATDCWGRLWRRLCPGDPLPAAACLLRRGLRPGGSEDVLPGSLLERRMELTEDSDRAPGCEPGNQDRAGGRLRESAEGRPDQALLVLRGAVGENCREEEVPRAAAGTRMTLEWRGGRRRRVEPTATQALPTVI